MRKQWLTTKELATVAVLAAIAAVLFMIEIPVVAFYQLDFSDLPVLLGTFAMGPLAGALILLIKSLLGLLHSSSMGVGELADFVMGLAMILPAGLIYRGGRSRKSALIGMLVGTLCAIVTAALVNLFVMIPFYCNVYGMQVEMILDMGRAVLPFIRSEWEFVLCITAPFNLLKFGLISLVAFMIYKPLSPLLHGNARSSVPEKRP